MSCFTTIGTFSLITVVKGSKYVPPILPQPTAWYKFNINTDICGNQPWLYYNYANGLYDASLNSYSTYFPPAGNCFISTPAPPSTYISPTSYYVNGVGGTSGNYSIICRQNKIFTPSTGFTVCFWYNTSTINGNGHQILSLTGGTGGTITSLAIYLQNTGNSVQCIVNGTINNIYSPYGSNNIWYHLAFVFTPTGSSQILVTYYRNAVQLASTTIAQAFPSNVTFGTSQLGVTRTANTYTYDFRFFPNVLSRNEIYSIYNFTN